MSSNVIGSAMDSICRLLICTFKLLFVVVMPAIFNAGLVCKFTGKNGIGCWLLVAG